MSFWARYVLLKEEAGVPRETTLAQIEAIYGTSTRQSVESELPPVETTTTTTDTSTTSTTGTTTTDPATTGTTTTDPGTTTTDTTTTTTP